MTIKILLAILSVASTGAALFCAFGAGVAMEQRHEQNALWWFYTFCPLVIIDIVCLVALVFIGT